MGPGLRVRVVVPNHSRGRFRNMFEEPLEERCFFHGYLLSCLMLAIFV